LRGRAPEFGFARHGGGSARLGGRDAARTPPTKETDARDANRQGGATDGRGTETNRAGHEPIRFRPIRGGASTVSTHARERSQSELGGRKRSFTPAAPSPSRDGRMPRFGVLESPSSDAVGVAPGRQKPRRRQRARGPDPRPMHEGTRHHENLHDQRKTRHHQKALAKWPTLPRIALFGALVTRDSPVGRSRSVPHNGLGQSGRGRPAGDRPTRPDRAGRRPHSGSPLRS
jgi:hypothetical protein